MSNKIRVASLFTGAGGLDIGFSNLPEFEVIFHTDIDNIAIETLRANKEEGKYIHEDSIINGTDIKEYDGGDLEPGDVDLVIGGPPCQPFSAAARRSGGFAGADSEDGQLFRAYVELLEEWNPKAFLFENVYGITSNEEDWQMIVDAFENEAGEPGYHPKARTLDAADYGVPQHRERTFIVGIRKDIDEEFHFPFPTHGPDSPTDQELISAGEALEGVDVEGAAQDPAYEITSKHAPLLEDIPPGLNYSFYTEKLGHHEPVFGWRSRFSDYLYKADPNQPVRTLKAQPGAASGPFHWENRKFTEEELKRLQTFPEDYTLKGSYGQVVKQIGNSVPPRIAEVLAKAIAQELFNAREFESVRPMPDDYNLGYRSRKRTSSQEYQRKAIEGYAELDNWDPRNLDLEQLEELDINDELRERLGLSPEHLRSHDQPGLDAFSGSSNNTPDVQEEKERNKITIGYQGYFDSKRYSFDVEVASDESRVFDVESYKKGKSLFVDITRRNGGGRQIDISLDPDDSLWNGVQSLQVTASGVELADIFYIWDISTTDVIERTGYEKFVDVVGHYSTTREDYSSSVTLTGINESVTARALVFFSNASNCNTEFTLQTLTDELNADDRKVINALSQLRQWRYEIRTSSTHATMPDGKILCTYPFPDMNKTSHFDSEIKLDSLRSQAD